MTGQSSRGGRAVQLRALGGTVWLSQRGMVDLCATTVTNVNHIMRRILDDGEATEATIDSESVVRREVAREVRRRVWLPGLPQDAPKVGAGAPRALRSQAWSAWLERPRWRGVGSSDCDSPGPSTR